MIERRQQYDPAQLLTRSAIFFVGVLVVFVCAIIGAQIFKSGEANTESWAALTGIIGWATGVVSGLFNHRFGTTQQSTAKDATIQQQAATAAIIAQTAGSAEAPKKVENVNIESNNTTVTGAIS